MKCEEKLRKTVPIRVNDSLLSHVNSAAEKLDISQQDAFRMLIRIGLACLEKTGYDLPKQIAEKALKK